jgi:biopolymer transport protein ExbD
MAKQLKKAPKLKEMDMLPIMSLMTILIPVLITMVAFNKLGIVDIKMPERSDNIQSETPPMPEKTLNLTVLLSKESGDRFTQYMEIWGTGGAWPKIYFREKWVFRCQNDPEPIVYDLRDLYDQAGNLIKIPECRDGKPMDSTKFKLSIENIELWAITKASAEDTGTVRMGVYSKNDAAYINVETNEFISDLSQAKKGASVATLAYESRRRLVCGERPKPGLEEDICIEGKSTVVLKALSAYDVLAMELMGINRLISEMATEDKPKDERNINVSADYDTAFDKIISIMDRARDAGFPEIQLGVLDPGGS